MEEESQPKSQFEYDLVVIGGGSGGLAAAKAAQKLGARVAVADFIKPSPVGTKWGLGGTCVNVGCIPKKLMHFAAGWGETHEAQKNAGWQIKEKNEHSWDELVMRVQFYIKKLNWGYKSELSQAGIKYYNALGKITGENKVELTKGDGEKINVTTEHILVSVGGRPTFLDDIPRDLVITSDDIFSLKKAPGKILVVGASYIALECAGFLHAFGYDVTVMVRSIFLRGFDQECANRIAQNMDLKGVKFINQAVPSKIEKTENDQREVSWIDAKTKQEKGKKVFDTVMLAIGRQADTQNLGLDTVGIKTAKNGKILANDDDSTDAKNIWAIGDCCEGRLELTPTAIMAGKLLVGRIFGNQKRTMNYINVATTVFTPLEYGAIGYSEEDAIAKFGEENTKVYQGLFTPLEWAYSDEREEENGFCKIIVDSSNNEKVIGFHYLGPHAGEVTQGFSVAINCGATYEHFVTTVGIHPTYAEELVKLTQVKGEEELKAAGC